VRWPLLARSIVVAACLGGCATLAGIHDGTDGTTSPGSGDAGADADAVASGEGGADASATCKPGNASDSTSRIHASRVTDDAPVAIDGSDAEWTCVDRLGLETGGRAIGVADGHDTARIAMQWGDQHLYLLANVASDSPGGTATGAETFKNDSLHLFLAGPNPVPQAGYRTSDHQIAMDYQKGVTDYGGGLTRPTIDGITATSGPFTDQNGTLSFVVEARIDASIIGRTKLQAGDVVRVNFQINDKTATVYRVWYWESAVCKAFTGCDRGGGASDPYCDPSCTGEVVLR
jgi:hypothetical protein